MTKMKKDGFSLIELIIVAVLIAVLVGIALPFIQNIQEQGTIARVKGELRILQEAVESYYIHNNQTFPPTGSAALQTALRRAVPKVISYVPTDPFRLNGADYVYVMGGTNSQFYIIYSVGPDSNGSATISGDAVTEVNGSSCIYVSNMGRDTTP